MNEPDRKLPNRPMSHFKAIYGAKAYIPTIEPRELPFDQYVQDLCDQALFRMECYIAELHYANEYITGARLIRRIERLRLADRRFVDPFWWH